MMMNKEIQNRFIQAETEWRKKILEVFDEMFNEYKNDYKKMAQLMIVVKERLDHYSQNDEMSLIYIELRARISSWSDSLELDDLDKFNWLADNYCIENSVYNW